MAEVMSGASAAPTRGLSRTCTVISALCRRFSAMSTTCVSKLSPRTLVSLVRPDSTCLRTAEVMTNCRPVYSTFILFPPYLHFLVKAEQLGNSGVLSSYLLSLSCSPQCAGGGGGAGGFNCFW